MIVDYLENDLCEEIYGNIFSPREDTWRDIALVYEIQVDEEAKLLANYASCNRVDGKSTFSIIFK